MKNIAVGDYVRTKSGIGRVEQIGNSLFWLEDGSSYSLDNTKIKHSKNIIDLIEVEDFVNNGYVYELGSADNGEKWVHTLNGLLLYKEEIETILTKEQYMQNCYKVERS